MTVLGVGTPNPCVVHKSAVGYFTQLYENKCENLRWTGQFAKKAQFTEIDLNKKFKHPNFTHTHTHTTENQEGLQKEIQRIKQKPMKLGSSKSRKP